MPPNRTYQAAGVALALLCTQVQPVFAQANSTAAQEHDVAGGDLMLISYIVLWIMIAAFLFVVLRKQRQVEHSLNQLEKRFDDILDDTP